MTFEEYVSSRGPALVRLARLLTGDEHRAEDLTQDVLARAYVHWRRIARADHPDVYVRRMLVNAESVLVEVAGGRRVAIDVAPGPVEVERSRHEGMNYGPDRTASADFDGRVERLPPAGPGGQPGWVLRW
ncbi:sigma factor, partial [Micromonospora purpureochromogenes]